MAPRKRLTSSLVDSLSGFKKVPARSKSKNLLIDAESLLDWDESPPPPTDADMADGDGSRSSAAETNGKACSEISDKELYSIIYETLLLGFDPLKLREIRSRPAKSPSSSRWAGPSKKALFAASASSSLKGTPSSTSRAVINLD